MKENLLKIVNHYGINHQLKYIHSEYYELDEAILNYLNTNSITNRLHIVEELTDVLIMLNQIKHYFNIKDEEIEEFELYKVDRQLRRINDEISVRGHSGSR